MIRSTTKSFWSTGMVALVLLCSACSSSDADEKTQTAEAVPAPSAIELRLDALIYEDGQDIQVVLDFGPYDAPEQADVLLVASESEDVEQIRVVNQGDGRLVSTGRTRIGTGGTDVADGTLALSGGEMFTALYFVDTQDPRFAGNEASIVADFGLREGNEGGWAKVEVVEEIRMTERELDPPPGGKRVGTIVPRDGLPVQIPTDELILFTADPAVLEAFLEESDGSIITSEPIYDGDGEPSSQAHLVRIDPMHVGPERLAQLRSFMGEDADLLLSNEEVGGVYASAIHYLLEGYPVAVNPKLQFHGAPEITTTEEANVDLNMTLRGCSPESPEECVFNVPAMWAFNALWDADYREIQVAVLDQGFADARDVRAPQLGSRRECDMTAPGGPVCGPGTAIGVPTVGNSFFGDKTWHGTGVASVIGGTVNNGIHVAGVGGQVAVPAYYKYDHGGYAFEIGAGFVQATDDGASCINISGGYPCNILTNIGPDFNICESGGRRDLCSTLAGVLAAATAAACGASSFLDFVIPGSGGLVCALTLGATTFSAGACYTTLSFGDVTGPMQSGAIYATARGVPIVASAGNTLEADHLPGILRDYVNLSDRTLDSWQLVPAAFRQTIAVGAVDASTLDNEHFFGNSVDIWAPIRSSYFAPTDASDLSSATVGQSIGGTSAAAPYVAGVIASMQAMNPDLDATTYDAESDFGVSRAALRQIPRRISAMLTDPDNSFSNDELVELGFADQPEERRLLINPLLAVQAAAKERSEAPFFDLEAEGYDASMGFSERFGVNDIVSSAWPVYFGVTTSGTIVSIEGEGTVAGARDVDWYTFTMPDSVDPNDFFKVVVEIDSPPNPSADRILLEQTMSGDHRPIRTGAYEVIARQSQQVWIKLGSTGDNVYKLTVSEPELAWPTVEIVSPAEGSTICHRDARFRARAEYPGFPDIRVADEVIDWWLNDVPVGSGRTLAPPVLAPGDWEVTALAFGSEHTAATRRVTVRECEGRTPWAEIIAPAGDVIRAGVDEHGPFAEVRLVGLAYDRDPGGEVDILWSTNRVDVQPRGDGLLVAVRQPSVPTQDAQWFGTVRLYTDGCGTTEHVITLEVIDDDDNVTIKSKYVWVRDLC